MTGGGGAERQVPTMGEQHAITTWAQLSSSGYKSRRPWEGVGAVEGTLMLPSRAGGHGKAG